MSALKLCPTCGTEYPANERFCPKDGTALRSQGGGSDLVGSIIADRYHVLKKLGEGGMGQVYLAEHVKMGRKSAVKVMNPGMVQDADAISRFNREAANASRINHQHVAGIYDFGETPEGLIYLAMEYVEGEPLTDLVQRSGALPPARAAELTRQTGEALAVAHDMGIVHRDLKPDNIMIARSRDGSDLVKVVDFGIAKAANVEAQKVTRTGLVVGTPEYMSPEQLAGDPLDGRSDIYSLGLVAFNMLTGHLPFPSETVQESMIMRLTDRPKRLGEMRPEVEWPAEVQEVMDRALQRDAAERFTSASEFGRALQAAVKHIPDASAAASTSSPATAVAGARTGLAAGVTNLPQTRVSDPMPPARSASEPVAKTPSRTPMLVGTAVGVLVLAGAGWMFVSSRGTNRDAGASTAAQQPAASAPQGSGPPGATQVATGERPSAPAAVPTGTSVSTVTTPVNPASAQRPASRGGEVGPPVDGGTSAVTGPAPGKSYVTELMALEQEIRDSSSAVAVGRKLPAWRSRVTLASDRAILQVVEAEVATLTLEAAQACKIWRSIKPEDLGTNLKNTYTAGMQSCAGT